MEQLESATEERQAARRYLYALGQVLLGNEPTADRLAVDEELLSEALAIVGLEDDGALAVALAAAREDVDGTAALWTKLFIGPATPAATPWESTYRSRSKALFRQETLEVRNAYRAQGFLPRAYPRVADDHIALELGFMAALAEKSLGSLQGGDGRAVRDAEEASLGFLNDHLLRWIDDYAADLSAQAPSSLYAALIQLIARLARRDAAVIAQRFE